MYKKNSGKIQDESKEWKDYLKKNKHVKTITSKQRRQRPKIARYELLLKY